MAGFRRLTIEAADPFAARLYAGWLRACLRWSSDVEIEITEGPRGSGRTPLSRVHLEGANVGITAAAGDRVECLTAAVVGDDATARLVPLGEGALSALIGEELGVRTRDLAFERALASALERWG